MTILGSGSSPLVLVQHSSRFVLEGKYGSLERKRVVKQGDNTLSFYRTVPDS